MQPKPSCRRGRQRSSEAEAAILKATAELLQDHALADISTDMIAARAGVSKATIYKWWPNKCHVALDAFVDLATEAAKVVDTGDIQADITRHLEDLIRFYLSPAGKILRQFIAAGQNDPKFLNLFLERYLHKRRREVIKLWNLGVERGQLPAEVCPEYAIDLLYGPSVMRLVLGHLPLNPENAAKTVAFWMKGLKTV